MSTADLQIVLVAFHMSTRMTCVGTCNSPAEYSVHSRKGYSLSSAFTGGKKFTGGPDVGVLEPVEISALR